MIALRKKNCDSLTDILRNPNLYVLRRQRIVSAEHPFAGKQLPVIPRLLMSSAPLSKLFNFVKCILTLCVLFVKGKNTFFE